MNKHEYIYGKGIRKRFHLTVTEYERLCKLFPNARGRGGYIRTLQALSNHPEWLEMIADEKEETNTTLHCILCFVLRIWIVLLWMFAWMLLISDQLCSCRI
jgi:hypothetical protein